MTSETRDIETDAKFLAKVQDWINRSENTGTIGIWLTPGQWFRLMNLARQGEKAAEEIRRLREALGQSAREETSMAQRMRGAIVEARRFLKQTRHNWNGPILRADTLLEEALTAKCRTTEQRQEDRDAFRQALSPQETRT